MSAAHLLEPNTKRHDLHDELESFLHVLLYHTIRYQTSHVSRKQRGLLRRTFSSHLHDKVMDDNGQICGGEGKQSFFQPFSPLAFSEPSLETFLGVPHVSLIETLRMMFIPIYSDTRLLKRAPIPNVAQTRDKAPAVLETSDQFIKEFKDHLKMNGWKENDASDEPSESDMFLTDATGLVKMTRHSTLSKRKADGANLDNLSGASKRSRMDSTPASLSPAVESESEE